MLQRMGFRAKKTSSFLLSLVLWVLLMIMVLGTVHHLTVENTHNVRGGVATWVGIVTAVVLALLWGYKVIKGGQRDAIQEGVNAVLKLKDAHEKMMLAVKESMLAKIFDTMEILHCGSTKTNCNWNKGARACLVDLLRIVDYDPEEGAETALLIEQSTGVVVGVNIELVGWKTQLKNISPSVFLMTLQYLMKLSKVTYAKNGLKEPTVWVTILPGYVCITDNSGGIARECLEKEDIEFMTIMESSYFKLFFNVEVCIDTCYEYGGHGLRATLRPIY